MSQNNLLQGYNWESQQFEDAQFTRSLQDEVISVYEVYVKEEEALGSAEIRGDGCIPISSITVSGESTNVTNSTVTSNEQQLIQRAIFPDDCMDLDEAMIDSEILSDDGTVAKLLGKDSLKYKLVEPSTSASVDGDESIVANQTISEQENGNSSSTGPRLIDKDDPRSRLHFVKYLKRDGKTLKIWECGICTKEFRHQYTLMRHLPTHTDERNFKCDVCGKAFRQLSTLSQHKAIHSDARPYICEFCKKTFNRVSTLISHRKTHSELKPHKCHVCGKGFHQKGNLRNHVFTHTNERPYKCELCGKGFNQMSNLVCHKIKAHAHSEKMQYSCGLCDKEFPRRFALRAHEEYKHGIKYRNPGGISREQKLQASQNSTSKATSASKSAAMTSTTCISTTATSTITPSGSSTGTNVMRNKNVRIVELPDGNDETGIGEISLEDYTDSLVIDRIETTAMENAIFQEQVPFALLKPVKGIPVLVKVNPAGPRKHLLTPATADDLRMIGKMNISPTITADPDGLKALQVKVPVVATIIQSFDENGKQSFTIEAPGPDQDEESLVAPLDSHFSFQDVDSSLRLHSGSDGGLVDRRSDDYERDEENPTTTPGELMNSQMDDCTELLELAAQGGIQFVRATEDGRYEVMTNSEARELMAQNSHDVTILDGEDADALNIVNSRGQASPTMTTTTNTTTTISDNNIHDDFMIDDPDSQIMVLDSMTNAPKSIGLEGIEIFSDKDIRILDPKNLDGMTFLSQMKIDDLILVPSKSSSCIENLTNSSSPSDSQEFPGISAIVNNANNQSMTSLLTKNQQSSNVSITDNTMNYLRQCPVSSLNLSEDLDILKDEENEPVPSTSGLSSENRRQQQHYSGIKLKYDDFDQTMIESDENAPLLSIGQRNVSQSCSRLTDFYRGNEARNYWDNQRNIPSFGEVKILGSKSNNTANCSNNHRDKDSLENSSLQLKDIRILGSYEQFLNSSAFAQQQQQFVKSVNSFSLEQDNDKASSTTNARKEIKILGKKLECGFFENNEDGKLVKIENDEIAEMTCRKMVSDVWEGWIETNRCANGNYAEDEDDEKENDITYADIIDS